MDICAAVIEYREQKSKVRHFYDPVTDTILNVIGFGIVAEPCLGKVYRTDAAQNVIINFIRGVKHFLAIGGLAGDIIYGMDQDDVIIFSVIISLDDLIIKLFQNRIILEFTSTQTKKKFLSTSFFFLFKRKVHIDEVFADGTGKCFFEDFKVFKHFFFRKRKKCFFQFGFFVFFSVNIAAADACNSTVIGCELFLDFGYFFFIHKQTPRI